MVSDTMVPVLVFYYNYLDFLTRSAKQTAARPVDGFLLDGLHLNGEDAEKMAFEEIGPIVKDVLELLPEDKVRIMHGAFDPELVLDLGNKAFNIRT